MKLPERVFHDRVRTSTLLMCLLWLGLFMLYLYVKPPVVQAVQQPVVPAKAAPYVPAAPVWDDPPVVETTTAKSVPTTTPSPSISPSTGATSTSPGPSGTTTSRRPAAATSSSPTPEPRLLPSLQLPGMLEEPTTSVPTSEPGQTSERAPASTSPTPVR